MPRIYFPSRARDGPITVVYGGRSANDKAQNAISVTNSIGLRRDDERAVSLAWSPGADPWLEPKRNLRLVICWTSPLDRTDWSIVRSVEQLMHVLI